MLFGGSGTHQNDRYFFISTGWGRIQIQDENYYVISIESPIGRLLKNKKEGDSIQFRNIAYDILSVS